MWKKTLSLAFFTLTSASGFAQEEKPVFPSWVYPCPKATTPPKIDGKLDDEAYRHAPIAGGFVDYHNPTKYVQPTTTFQIVHHDNSLYFAVRCEEPDLDKIKPRPPEGRDAILAIGETVEIFLDPEHDHQDYYQWIPSIHGDLYDGHRMDKSWDSNINFAPVRGEGYWAVEVQIPLAQIGLDGLTQWQVLGLRVCRNRWLKSSKFWSSWSYGGFHNAPTYDHLVICDESGEIPEDKLTELMPAFRRDNDEKVGPVLIARSAGPSGESFSSLGEQTLLRTERSVAELEAMAEFLQKRAAALRDQVDDLRARAPTLNAGTYPVFILDSDALLGSTEDAYWAARKDALLKLMGAKKTETGD